MAFYNRVNVYFPFQPRATKHLISIYLVFAKSGREPDHFSHPIVNFRVLDHDTGHITGKRIQNKAFSQKIIFYEFQGFIDEMYAENINFAKYSSHFIFSIFSPEPDLFSMIQLFFSFSSLMSHQLMTHIFQ